jgi:hypothetical protein
LLGNRALSPLLPRCSMRSRKRCGNLDDRRSGAVTTGLALGTAVVGVAGDKVVAGNEVGAVEVLIIGLDVGDKEVGLDVGGIVFDEHAFVPFK